MQQASSIERLGVNFIGDLRVRSGLGEAAMATVDAALASGVPIAYRELLTPFDQHDPLAAQYAALPTTSRYSSNLLYYNAESLGSLSDREIRLALNDHYTAGVWFWELAQMPARYGKLLTYLDEMWVASRFVRDAVLDLDADLPVEVIPVPINLTVPAHVSRAEFGIPNGRFVFLFTFAASSHGGRKNPFAVIDAFERAFGRADSRATDHGPLLVIKAHHAAHLSAFRDALAKAVERVGGLLIEDQLTRAQMNALLSCADAYVSLHRSEGFGLGMAESMYLGKPVIGTAYSGNVDFMTNANSYLIDYRLRPITMADHAWFGEGFAQLYEPGVEWAYPDIEQAAACMKRLYEHPQEGRERGARAAEDIRRLCSPTVVGEQIATRLQQIALQRLAHKSISVPGAFTPLGAGVGAGPDVDAETSNRPVLDNRYRTTWYEWYKVRADGDHTRLDRAPLIGPLARILKRTVLLGRLSLLQTTLNQETLERLEWLTTQASLHNRKLRDMQRNSENTAQSSASETKQDQQLSQIQQYVDAQVVHAESRMTTDYQALADRLDALAATVARLDNTAHPERHAAQASQRSLATSNLASVLFARVADRDRAQGLSAADVVDIVRFVGRAVPELAELPVVGLSRQFDHTGEDRGGAVEVLSPIEQRSAFLNGSSSHAAWYHIDLTPGTKDPLPWRHIPDELTPFIYLVVVTPADNPEAVDESSAPPVFRGDLETSERLLSVSIWQEAPAVAFQVASSKQEGHGE